MIPSSAVRVVEISASRLMVICPPYYGAATFSLVLSVIMFVATWFTFGRDLGRQGVLILLASNLPFFLVSGALATTGASAVLDSQAGVLEVRSRVAGIPTHQSRVPLSDVVSAVVETSKGSRRVAFRLKNGSNVPVGFFTNQPGHNVAAAAIDRFLSRVLPLS